MCFCGLVPVSVSVSVLEETWSLVVSGTSCSWGSNHMLTWLPLMQRNIEELTGSCKRLDRQGLWEEDHKKIFFCTPQTFRNDVDRGQGC